MVINYKRAQKTILRVSPRVPLADHLPAICEKCEFDVESTVLSRDVQSLSPLDLSCSLNDYAIREVYARDTKSKSSLLNTQSCYFGFNTVTHLLPAVQDSRPLLRLQSHVMQVSKFGKTAVSTRVLLTSHDFTTLAFLCLCTVFPSKDKTQKEEENKGLFSKFRKSRKKSEQVM